MAGHLIGIVGLPGDGKSHMARSCRDLGKTAIAVCDPKEASFYGAEGVECFADLEWRPHASVYQATALRSLFAWLDKQVKDESVKYVVIDPMSAVSAFAMQEVLKIHGTGDPSDVANGKAWTGHDVQIRGLLVEIQRLFARGKTVVCTFHAQLKELEGAGDAKQGLAFGSSKNAPKMEWQFQEQILPAMLTSIRQRIAAPFDLWLHTKPQGFGAARKFYVTAEPDSVRPAKHSVTWKAGTNLSMIPNTMRELLARLDEGPQVAAIPAASAAK